MPADFAREEGSLCSHEVDRLERALVLLRVEGTSSSFRSAGRGDPVVWSTRSPESSAPRLRPPRSAPSGDLPPVNCQTHPTSSRMVILSRLGSLERTTYVSPATSSH